MPRKQIEENDDVKNFVIEVLTEEPKKKEMVEMLKELAKELV